MDGWLHCVVSPGQFSGEHGVEVRTSAGEVFFAAEEIELPAGSQSDYNGEATHSRRNHRTKGRLTLKCACREGHLKMGSTSQFVRSQFAKRRR